MNCQYVQYVSYSSMPIQAHGMNHFITFRGYSDCSRTYVWCSTENTVSLFPLSKTYLSLFLLPWLTSWCRLITLSTDEDSRGRGSIMVSRHDPTFVKLNWFRSDDPLFFYLFINFTSSVTTLSLSNIATYKLNKL